MPAIIQQFVEVCIFKFEDDRPSYLLLRRSKDETYYPNIWQFVTGTIEANEQGVDAARRELFEETGLTPTGFWVIPHINSFYSPGDDTINLNPMFAAQVAPGSVPKLSSEHQAYRWCTYDEAIDRLVWFGQQQGLHVVREFIVKGREAMRQTRIS